jgi:hypothetical protein
MCFIKLFPEERLVCSLYTAGNDDADEDSEEDERTLDGGPATMLLVFDGEGFEEEVE